jgi:hypothetical protein
MHDAIRNAGFVSRGIWSLPIKLTVWLIWMSFGLSLSSAQFAPQPVGQSSTVPLRSNSNQTENASPKPSPSSSSTANSNTNESIKEAPRASGSPGRQGAQSLADFTELIALIRSTVDGQWDSGEDKIETFLGGVWIDPAGKLHREKSSTSSGKNASRVTTHAKPKNAALNNPQPTESNFTAVPMLDAMGMNQEVDLRWISIREVDELLNRDDRKSSVGLELLGGLSRVDYVARDPKTQEWFLGGPAGGLVLDANGNLVSRSTGLPPILLEDLLCVAPLILHGKGPLGCSIDPVPQLLQKLTEQVKTNAFIKQLRSKPENATQFLSDTLGDQRATFFGLPNDSPTAMALLVADEHMKRVGMGMVDVTRGPLRSDVINYWQACEKSGTVPGDSMVRWWFALPSAVSIGVDETGDVFSIQSSTVRVLSQKQFLDDRGTRHDSAEKDLAADAFAESFTKAFPDLQKQFSAYGRLRHIFDLAVVLEVITEETPNRNNRPLSIASSDEYRPRVAFPIQWVPSIASWRKTDSGRVAAVVSGGVMIDVSKTKLDRITNASVVERKKVTSVE